MIKCSICGKLNEDDAKHCSGCGTWLIDKGIVVKTKGKVERWLRGLVIVLSALFIIFVLVAVFLHMKPETPIPGETPLPSPSQVIPPLAPPPPVVVPPAPIPTPVPPVLVPPATIPTLHHNTAVNDIMSNPAYLNLAWQGRDAELQAKTREINQEYFTTHTYIPGQTVCADMTVDIWNMLQTVGITSIIVAGNLDLDNPTFAQCNHSWLLILSLPQGKTEPGAFALESTNGQIYFSNDTSSNSSLNRYWRGFFYTKPSDFRADFKERW